jgi:hypothetical protein
MMKARCPICESEFDSQRPKVALDPNRAPWYRWQKSAIFCPKCEHPLELSKGAKRVTAIAFITALVGVIAGTTVFGFGDTFVGTIVTVASIAVPFSLARVLLGRSPYIAANAPNKGFNRTPESSGPAKPGKFGGGAG